VEDGTLNTPLWPLALYFAAALALPAVMIGLSYLLGEAHSARATGEPYESGMVATGSLRLRSGPAFYLMAVFFVVFDLEVLFIIAWALCLREVGWNGYVQILIFIGVLMAALVYLWRVGALDLRR
jgi:NADH-quinone oxidoreductase subunit A